MNNPIALSSFRKSGNYLFMKTLQNILEINKSWKTFSGSNDTWKKTYSKEELAYPEELEIDELVYFEKNRWQLYKGKFRNDLTTNDVDNLSKKTSFLLTHEAPDPIYFNSTELSNFNWCYLVRDIMPTLNSLMHFLTSEVILKREPTYKITDVKDLISNDGFLDNQIERWMYHTKMYIKYKKYYRLFRYEDIVNDKEKFVRDLIRLSKLNINKSKVVLENLSFENMKKNAPQHVRVGKKYDYKKYFSEEKVLKIESKCKNIRQELGYR